MPEAGTIIVELAGIPEGKGRPRFRAFNTKAGHAIASAYTPAKTRKYENALRYAAQEAMNGRAPLDGPVTVTVHALMPVPTSWSRKKREAALRGDILPVTKPDWENIAKNLDAFNEVVWRDDRQVCDGRVVKRYSDRPALRVEVREAAPAQLHLLNPRPSQADAPFHVPPDGEAA